MDQSGNFIPITKSDRVRWLKQADAYMAKVEWADKSKVTSATDKLRPSALIPTTPRVSSQMTAISLIDVGHEESKDQLMLTEVIMHVLQTIRKGLTIGLHLEELYTKSSGLDVLLEQNRGGKLTTLQQPELAAKSRMRASITIFALASYVVWDLAAYRTEEVSNVVMTVDAPDGLHFATTQEAIRSTFFYFGKDVQQDGKVESDAEFVKFALLYFRNIIEAVKLREAGLTFKEPFTERKYKLDDCEFIIDGFKAPEDRSVVSVEFNRVPFSDIVGNRIAKHNSMRTIMRMLCYDLEVKMNPMRELGGLAPIRLGHGVPGTGKSMTIAAIATELADRAKWLKIPFLFHPLPDAIVSTYQGGSAERMMAWMNALRDATKLVYAPIDDAENSFENRTRQGVSSGVREVIAVFLRNTEGAYAVNRGNTLIDVCTNLPEQVDPAVMSRIVERFEINGAQTVHDFIDQDHGWWKKYANMSSQFIDMDDPTNYGYFDDQKPMTSLSKSGERYTEAKNSDIKEIVAQTYREQDPRNQRFFGALYYNVRQKFTGFSSRDVRNIQSAVTARMLDFDFPLEWLDEPTRFFLTPYEEKKGVLVELLKANMQGLSFREIRMEEALRYLDTMAGIANIDFERQVGRTMESLRVQQEAMKRLKS